MRNMKKRELKMIKELKCCLGNLNILPCQNMLCPAKIRSRTTFQALQTPAKMFCITKFQANKILATKFQRNLANLALTFQKLSLYCLPLPETRNKIKKGQGK